MADDGARPEVLETIPVVDLVASWRRDFGIDVAKLFEGVVSLQLCRDPASARIYFDPPVAGTPGFYGTLRSFEWYQPISKAEHEAAGELIGPSDRVLDIGAGTGAFADRVHGAAYEGIEPDPESVRRARALGRDLTSRTLAETAARRAERFTVVTAFQVLEHVADPDAFVAAAVRCLAPGGRLILGLPDSGGYLARLPDFVLNAPPHHLTWWREDSLRDLLRCHGLAEPSLRRFPVETWERRLWWMAKIARLFGGERHFGKSLRGRKVVSWLAAGLLQALKPPAGATGATLLAVARKR